MAQVMGRKAESPTTWQAAASAEAAAAVGHESTPVVEDDDIEGALIALGLVHEPPLQRDNDRPAQAGGKPAEQRPFASAVAAVIASGVRHDVPDPPTPGSLHAEMQQLRRRLAQVSTARRIPKRPAKMARAICALLQHPDEGKKPSALGAARQAGLVDDLASKLAYQVPVKGEAVNAGICLLSRSPFVRQLLQDEGWLRQVTGKHASLAALAKTLENARRSLIGRAVAPLNRRAPHAAQPQAAVARKGNRRGAWHADAWELEDQGHRIPDIAAKLCRSSNAVQKALSLRRKPHQT
jgi:hypothetical protein